LLRCSKVHSICPVWSFGSLPLMCIAMHGKEWMLSYLQSKSRQCAEMIIGNEESELVALCDNREKSLLGIEKYETNFFQSIEELLDANLDIDVINICTPNGLHSDQASLVLDKGIHVVVEKPIGLSKAKCEKVIHKALTNHKYVFAVMQNRYSPPTVWIKDIIENKILGDVFMVQLNCYWNIDSRYYKTDGWKGTHDSVGTVAMVSCWPV